jgi:hypothetical protein
MSLGKKSMTGNELQKALQLPSTAALFRLSPVEFAIAQAFCPIRIGWRVKRQQGRRAADTAGREMRRAYLGIGWGIVLLGIIHMFAGLRPSAFLPVAMSLGTLATVGTFIALHGTAPQADEGAAAHIWQLLMAAQAPIVLFFAIKWVPQSPRQAAPILALQAGAALAAMAPVFLLHW